MSIEERRSRTERAALSERLEGGRGTFLASATRVADLEEAGWVEVEVVAEGVAVSHRQVGEVPEDGRRTFATGITAPYRTRAVVRRPADPAAFSGTLVVEWLNVSSGLDANPDWSLLAPELVRTGVAWIGLSAQVIGVEGGPVLVESSGGTGVEAGTGLKGLDPERYGTLSHPGDAYAFDIFTQVGAAVRAGAPEALGDLVVQRVLAVGESQSAFALTTYVNGVHPAAREFDGFLVHSRGRRGLEPGDEGGGAGPRAPVTGPPERIRDDLDVPVMIVQTETDLLPVLGYAEARQDDTDHVRLWEVAGTAHADASMLGPFASMVDCGVPINDGPHRFVARAALRHLVGWAAGGDPPPAADRLVVDLTGGRVTFPRDVDGIALGGIRLPQVEVPVAALSGEPGPVTTLMCQLLGSTHALPVERLAELYPTADAYLEAYTSATDEAVSAGFALPEDRDEILADARPDLIPT